MRRRSLIQNLFAWICFKNSRLSAQPSIFPGKHESTLKELAATVLPESLGKSGSDAVVAQFVQWVQEYRPGAEMQTGYGFTRVRYKPPSPASRYLTQLDQLASEALAHNGVSARRLKIAQALQAANVQDLTSLPNGAHVASDLMTFYFQSTEANDCAYLANVGKDQCRGLKNSGKMPTAFKQDPTSAKV